MPQRQYGPIAAEDLKAVLFEMARAAMSEVLAARNPAIYPKASYAGVADEDLATDADYAAQAACEVIRRQRVPWAGAVGEERDLRVGCNLGVTLGANAYFTYDGLDGTRHFANGAREGVGSMVAFVYDHRVVGAAVGDVFAGLIYLLDPVTGHVLVIDDLECQPVIDLSAMTRGGSLAAGTVLLRGGLDEYPPVMTSLLFERGVFPNLVRRSKTSIGLTMAELWKGSVSLHAQSTGFMTPWDDTPIVGISQALGMVYLRPAGALLREFTPVLPTNQPRARQPAIILHRSYVAELSEYVPVRMLPNG